jgi:hypothetical protein
LSKPSHIYQRYYYGKTLINATDFDLSDKATLLGFACQNQLPVLFLYSLYDFGIMALNTTPTDQIAAAATKPTTTTATAAAAVFAITAGTA